MCRHFLRFQLKHQLCGPGEYRAHRVVMGYKICKLEVSGLNSVAWSSSCCPWKIKNWPLTWRSHIKSFLERHLFTSSWTLITPPSVKREKDIPLVVLPRIIVKKIIVSTVLRQGVYSENSALGPIQTQLILNKYLSLGVLQNEWGRGYRRKGKNLRFIFFIGMLIAWNLNV